MRVLLHAPTARALARARSNLRNLTARNEDAEVLIVANAEGVVAALAERDGETDSALRLCENTLAARGLEAPEGLATVPAAVETIARLQTEGWIYIRA